MKIMYSLPNWILKERSLPIESKVKTPPSQKKAHAYEGKTFKVQNLAITPAGEYLVTGQIEKKKIVNKGKDIEYRYYDIVCLHFDAKGKLKAQYAVEKMNDDSKSEKFQSIQNFFISQDGKTVYWEILEVKGTKGYTSIMDAYNGDPTFIANYFPRIAKINLSDASLSDFTVLGDEGKFLMYRYHSYLTDENTNVRYYLGHDKDYEKLWVGSYQLE